MIEFLLDNLLSPLNTLRKFFSQHFYFNMGKSVTSIF